MAKCEVQVDVETPAIAGGTLQGYVLTRVHDRVETNALKLWVGWRTRGLGERDGVVVDERVLHDGELSGEQRFHFTVALPNGPLTYHGRDLSVEWYAAATVDLDWAADSKGQRFFRLAPGPGAEDYVYGDHTPRLGPVQSPVGGVFGYVFPANAIQRLSGGWVVGLLFCIITGLSPLLIVGPGNTGLGLNIFSAVFVCVPLLFMGQWWWTHSIAQRLGPVKVSLSAIQPTPGETVTVRIELTPARSFDLNDVTAELSCTEFFTHRNNGTSMDTGDGGGLSLSPPAPPYHEFFRERISLSSGRRRLQANEPTAFTGQWTIPNDAPPSFFSESNSVDWDIDLRIEIPNGLDWSETVSLGVQPARCGRTG